MSKSSDNDRALREEKHRNQRVSKVNRILQALENEFSAHEMADIGIDLWLAMQLVCGPREAARLISCSQIE